MSKLKIVETAVTPQYNQLYTPNRRRRISQQLFRVWANTSKGWFVHKQEFPSKESAARMEVRIIGQKINTTHWQETSL